MAFRFECLCGNRLRAAERNRGLSVSCPACGREIVVPGGEPQDDGFSQAESETYSLKRSQDEPSDAEKAPVFKMPAPTQRLKSSGASEPLSQPRSKRGGGKSHRKLHKPKSIRQQPPDLINAWMDSFVFPFRGEGKWMLLAWTVVNGCLLLLWSLLPFLVGVFAVLPLMILFLCYVGCYLFQVLRAAANGDDELPSTNQDLFKWFVCLLIGFAPLIFYLARLKATGSELNSTLLWSCVGFAVFYTPMALLAAILAESLLAAEPYTVLSAIFKIPVQYFLTCLLIIAVMTAEVLFAKFVPSVPPFTEIFEWFVSLYTSIVVMHLLGTVYYRNRERIGWFRTE